MGHQAEPTLTSSNHHKFLNQTNSTKTDLKVWNLLSEEVIAINNSAIQAPNQASSLRYQLLRTVHLAFLTHIALAMLAREKKLTITMRI
jgi:hypothetical protein